MYEFIFKDTFGVTLWAVIFWLCNLAPCGLLTQVVVANLISILINYIRYEG